MYMLIRLLCSVSRAPCHSDASNSSTTAHALSSDRHSGTIGSIGSHASPEHALMPPGRVNGSSRPVLSPSGIRHEAHGFIPSGANT